jgi:uncharacterized delta-60 repeat protein
MNIGITIGKVKKSISKTDLTKTIPIPLSRFCVLDNLGQLKFNFGTLYKTNIWFYDENTYYIRSGFNNDVKNIVVQSDDKILLCGVFTTYNGTIKNRIIRLNTDGSIDDTFDIGTGFNSDVNTIAIQSDGKILVGGGFSTYNGFSINRIARLNTDGSLDVTFDIGTGFNLTVNKIAIQSDGKIIVGGFFSTYNGTSKNKIIRLNTDGSIDNTFDIGTGINSDVITIAIQSDNKILLGGNFTSYNGTSKIRIARINKDGSIDNTFIIGSGFANTVNVIAIQSDGKILVGGVFTSYNGTIKSRIARLNTDGSIDNTFDIEAGFNSTVNSIVVQSDDKILVGGFFATYKETSKNRIARLNTDGSVDNTFDIREGFNSIVYDIAVKSDGQILVGGNNSSFNGI